MAMDLDRQQILNLLTDAKPFLQNRYKLQEIALFGSYARNEETAESDVDLMVVENTKSFRDYSAMYHYVSSLFTGKKVQMVSKNAIKPQYFERLKSDLVYV